MPLLLAIYQIITGNRVYTDESKHISVRNNVLINYYNYNQAEVTNAVLSFTRNCKILKREVYKLKLL